MIGVPHDLWCRLLGHCYCWHCALEWGYTHAPMCTRCGHVPLGTEE